MLGAVAACVIASAAHAAEPSFTELSLTELMNEPVTTVFKKTIRLGEAPTAVTVITADDIRRNGFTSIPEALRLVPGFDVARIDASHWAISSRGLNLQYANTLLVMVDGRSVYTPAFGGVYWDAQDTTLEDLDRIEVIRGPGATLWGANAVNGVVNIVSKSSRDTQGALLSATAGTEDRPSLDARYGGSLGEDGSFRVYGKYFSRDGLETPDGGEAFDDWRTARFGFRTDWQRAADELLTVQGDYYSLRSDHLQRTLSPTPPFAQLVFEERASEGANLLGRWTRTLSSTSHVTIQSYIDSYEMALEHRHTADVQLEYRFAPAARHDVVWGAGYRVSRDDLHLSADAVTQAHERTLNLYTAFVQDEITLLPEKVRLTAGVKLEHNDFTGIEVQPNLRLFFSPNARNAFWMAASRAISTPSRFYHDARLDALAFQQPPFPVTVVALMPNSSLPSQKLDAYEIGYRVEPASNVSLDVAAFYNRYERLYRQVDGATFFESPTDATPPSFGPPGSPGVRVVMPLLWQADASGRAHGIEAAASWRPLDTWQLNASYSWLHFRVPLAEAFADGSPAHQASLRSHFNVSRAVELSTGIYYVDSVESLHASLGMIHIPSYVRLDAGAIYRPSASLELSLWGQNLLDPRHAEMSHPNAGMVVEVPRSLFARIAKKF